MMQNLKKTAANLGLPLGNRQKTYNSRLAQELGKWAETKNTGDAFHTEAFKVYFVDGKNIAKLPVLLDLAEFTKRFSPGGLNNTQVWRKGLKREEAESVILNRTFKEAVDEDWALSIKNGIKAVPTFKMKNDQLVGAQSYGTLERMFISNGVKKR